MSSKQAILAAVRRQTLPPVELPEPSTLSGTYAEPLAKFTEMLGAVGGRAIRVPNMDSLEQGLATLDVYQSATRVYSQLPGVSRANVDLAAITDPKQLNGLDVAVLRGEFGVAENGAVWVKLDGLAQRAVHVAAEHLVLVVPATELVHNMHQAYQRLSFDGPSYRLFISGPSKTADIEQSLVIGAQGPRSLVVVLVG